MLDPAIHSAVRQSWGYVRNDTPALTERFYGRLFEAAPGVRPLFAEDMRSQQTKLARTLEQLVFGLDQVNTIILVLTELAERHVEYGAEPEHYAAVSEALVWALEDQIGDAFTDEHRAAWEETLQLVSSVMIDAQNAVAS